MIGSLVSQMRMDIFLLELQKKKTDKTVTTRNDYIISQDKRSVSILYKIQKKLNCGSVHKAGGYMMEFKDGKRKNIAKIIIPFFTKYTLKTGSKQKQFVIFIKTFLLKLKERPYPHMDYYHLKKGVDLAICKYEGLILINSPILVDIADITKILPEQIAALKKLEINSNWLAGYIDGNGCFVVTLVENYPRPQLIILAEKENVNTLFAIKAFLECGIVYKRKKGHFVYQISSITDFQNRLFPHLYNKRNGVKLHTVKKHQLPREEVIDMMVKKEHLDYNNFEKLRLIKTKMATFVERDKQQLIEEITNEIEQDEKIY